MLRREEKQIGANTFAVNQMPAMRALKMSTRLGRLFGPAMAKLAGSGPPASLLDVDTSALSPAISMLFDGLTESEIESLTKELLATCEVQIDGKWVELFGKNPVFDLVMGGDVLGIYKLIYFAVEVNYADFFAEFRGLIAAGTKAVSRSAESTISKSDGQPSG